MKRLMVVLGLLVAAQSSAPAHYRPHGSVAVSFGVFYSSLSPHGEWIALEGDVYAWRPAGVPVGWRPYTVGRWVWTDFGWYWISDEPWGWASYHYGRWYYDDFYGWIWLPGYEWAPAWVEWRYGGDYIGWAPLGPYAVFSISFGIHYRRHWVTPHYYWSFVDCRYVTRPFVHKYVYRVENNTRYIGRTRSGGNVRYDRGRVVTRGPEREYVERRGKIRVQPVEVVDVSDRQSERVVRSGERERIEVFRPKIEERGRETGVVRPERVRSDERRRIGLDLKGTDVRAREEQKESGRDVRRAEQSRVRKESTPSDSKNDQTGREQRVEKREPSIRKDGSTERRPAPSVRQPERRSEDRQQVRKEQPADRKKESVDRPQQRREEFRSKTPERTVRRQEPKPQEQRLTDSSPKREGRSR